MTSWRALLCLLFLVLSVLTTLGHGCSCPLRHPQQHYCEADFVANVKVRKVITLPGGQNVIKVRVRRLLKTTPKATAALHKKMIYTIPGTCSLNITSRSMHVITGDIQAGKPWTSACHFASPWSTLAPKMKKGFRLLYQRGCDCPILSCHWWENRCPTASFFCSWRTSAEAQDCQTRHGVCLRKPDGRCSWLGGRSYRGCMKKWKTYQSYDISSRRRTNVATLIGGGHSSSSNQLHTNDVITSNDVVPVIEDIEIPPAVLSVKEKTHRGTIALSPGIGASYSLTPKTATARIHKPQPLKPSQYKVLPSQEDEIPHPTIARNRHRPSALGPTYSSRLATPTQYLELHGNIDSTTPVNPEVHTFVSNHIDGSSSSHQSSEKSEPARENKNSNVDFSGLFGRRKYPEYTTRIGYIADK